MDNKILKTAVIFVILLSTSALLFGASGKNKKNNQFISAVVDENGNVVEDSTNVEERWQILEWEDDNPQSVLYYEVSVEQYDKRKNKYSEVYHFKTASNENSVRIEPALSPGEYRYKVITYNLLGVAEIESDYFDFSIIKAYMPKVNGISSSSNGSSTLYIEEYNDGVFTADGRNLYAPKGTLNQEEKPLSERAPETDYMLVKKGLGKKIDIEILEHDKNNRGFKFKVDMDKFDSGTYYLLATDASGLQTQMNSSNEIVVKYRKMFDFDLSGGYSLPVTLYDSTFPDYLHSNISFLAFNLKGSFIFSKHKFGYLGAGVNGHYQRMSYQGSDYSIQGNVFDVYLNFVYQYPVYLDSNKDAKQKKHFITLEARAGAGILMLQNLYFSFPHDIKSSPLNSIYISAQAGFSVQFYLTNRLFVETGFDYITAFCTDAVIGQIIPMVSVGWQF